MSNWMGIGKPLQQEVVQPRQLNQSREIQKSNMPVTLDDIDDEEVIDLEYIISEKPKPKIVREFMKENLASIKSEEDLLFGLDGDE